MRGARVTFVVVASLASNACKVDTPMAREQAALVDVNFDVPTGWSRTDTARAGIKIAEWTPSGSNDSKEAVTVMRSELAPAIAKAGETAIEPYLRAAQRGLPGAKLRAVKQIASSRGLVGVQVDLEFVPSGSSEPYRRMHAVFVDGSRLVHVLYTSRKSDADPDVFAVVVDNLAHQEG